MKNKLFLCFVIFVLFLIGCNSQKQEEIPDFNSKSICIDEKVEMDYSFVKSARFVFLDSKTPIGKIDKLLFTEDNIFILDGISKTIHYYNHNGKLQCKINAKGKGSGEYISLSDFALNKTGNELIILDSSGRKILFYSMNNGKYIREFPLNFGPTKIAFSNEKILLYNPFIFNYNNNNFKYSVIVLNTRGDILEKHFKNTGFNANLRVSTDAFYWGENDLLFCNKLGSTIYKYDINLFIPVFNIRFKENKSFGKYLKDNVTNRNFNKLIETNFCYDIHNICETEDYIYFKYIKGNTSFHTIVHKNNGKVLVNESKETIISSNLVKNKIPIFVYPEYCHKDEFAAIFEPSSIKSIYDYESGIDFSKEEKKIFEKFFQLKVNDNPVIGFYKYDFGQIKN